MAKKKKIDDYIKDMASSDETIRRNAVAKLGNYEDPLAISAIKQAFTDDSASVRFYAKKSLQKLMKTMGAEEINKHNPINEEEKKILVTLNSAVEEKNLEKIIGFFTNDSGVVRAASVSFASDIIDEHTTYYENPIGDILIGMLDDPHIRVVANTVEVLEKIKCRKAEDKLLKLLFHEDARVKANVACAIFNIFDDKPEMKSMALARLKEIVQSEKPWIRQSAVYALSTIDTDESMEILKSVQNDKEKMIRTQVKTAIKKEKLVIKSPVKQDEQTVNPVIKQETNINKTQEIRKNQSVVENKTTELIEKTIPEKKIGLVKDKPEIKPPVIRKPVVRKSVSVEDNKEEWIKKAKIGGLGCGAFLLLIFIVAFFQACYEIATYKPPEKNTVIVKNTKSEIVENNPFDDTKNKENISDKEARAVESINEINKGMAELKVLEFEKALANFESAFEKNPDNEGIKTILAVTHLEYARKFYEEKKYEKAKTILGKSRKYKQLADERFLMAEILLKTGGEKEALIIAENGLSIEESSAKGNFLYGKLLIAAGKNKKGIRHLKKAVDLDRSSSEYHLYFGRALAKHGLKDRAVDSVVRAMQLEPTPAMYKRLADISLECDRPAIAIKAFKELIRKRPKDLKIKSEYADILLKTGLYAKSIEVYSEILKKKTNNPDLNFKISLAYQAMGNTKEMRKYLEKTVALKSDFFEAQYTLASLLYCLKEEDKALRHLEKAIKLKPDYIDTYLLISKINMNKKKYKDTIEILKKALKIDAKNIESHLIIGQAYYLSTQPGPAVEHFNKFLELEPKKSMRRIEIRKIIKKIHK